MIPFWIQGFPIKKKGRLCEFSHMAHSVYLLIFNYNVKLEQIKIKNRPLSVNLVKILYFAKNEFIPNFTDILYV